MRKLYLSLTGGLGNQLFQMAAALAVADGDEILVEWTNSRPRLNSESKPEISDFIWPGNVTFQESHKFQILSSKSIGYLLRMGVNPKRYEKSLVFQSLASFLASVVNISTFRSFARIGLNQGVGYFSNISRKRRGSLHLVGYFQTYKWLETARFPNLLNSLKVREPSEQLLKLSALAKKEEPLIVHMRFGDYRLESSFGLLTQKYYQESVNELWGSGDFKSVWVFSDEIDEARRYLQDMKISEIRYIPDVANSSAQTLEAMRLGQGYVIGNSSFSWWAAKLSNNSNAKVIAPTPWFIGQDEPSELIPPNWTRRMGH
jgi:hypothetical protein